MPQRSAMTGPHRHPVAGRIACERQPGLGGQHSRAGASLAKIVVPTYLPGSIVDGPQHALAVDAIVRTRPAVRAVSRLEEINAVGVHGADDEQPGLLVKARPPIVGSTAPVRPNQ